MQISKVKSSPALLFLLHARAPLIALFFILMGVSVAGQAAAEWDTLIEGLESQEVLEKNQAEALKEYMRKNTSSPYDLEWKFKIQTQAAWTKTSSDNDDASYNTMELRRLRWGLRAQLGHDFIGEAEASLVPGRTRLQEATLSWEPAKTFNLRAGFDKPFSSLDENTSSSKLVTVERSHVSNTIADPGESTGVILDGAADKIYYGFGVFTDQEGANTEGEAAKWMHNLLIGAAGEDRFGNSFKVQATWILSKDAKGLLGSEFEKAGAVGLLFDFKVIQLQAEALKGESDLGEIEGAYVLTAYNAGKHQVVLRVEGATASGGRGISLPGRYSADTGLIAATDLGNRYRAGYLGWNYNFTQTHKVMVGLEKAKLSGTSLGNIEANTMFLAWRAAL